MTIEELKDMINSIIISNGEKQISAADLQSVLIEIVNTASESGAKRLKCYIPANLLDSDLPGITSEEQAENVEFYNAIKDAYDNDGDMPMFELIANIGEANTNIRYSCNGDILCGNIEDTFMVMIISVNLGELKLNADGSITTGEGSNYSLLSLKNS